jgi:hypothetical protein
MATLTTATGRVLDTQTLPSQYEPIFCSACGCRIGWSDDDNQGLGSGNIICDDCAADLQE